MALVGLPLHVIVIIAGAVLVTVIGVWHTPNGVSCDATENMYRLSIFTSSTKSLYPFKATVRNETALGTCKAVAVRAHNDITGRGIVMVYISHYKGLIKFCPLLNSFLL